MGDCEIGPGLAALLSIQEEEAQAANYPAIELHAHALVSLSDQLGHPLIWPVGDAAERVVGAATLMSQGQLRVRQPNFELVGQEVLVFSVAALSPLSILMSAEHVLRQGASSVHACGIRIDGLDEFHLGPLASFNLMSQPKLTSSPI